MKAGDGLHPSSKGKRVRFSGSERTVIDGPFTETRELIAGFWIWQVKSMDDALSWLKRAPFDGGTEIEVRPIFEMEDFGKEFTPEAREREARLRAEIESKSKGPAEAGHHVTASVVSAFGRRRAWRPPSGGPRVSGLRYPPAAAFSSVAMSIFFIVIIACIARPAFPGSGEVKSFPRISGTICHDSPNLSFSQPH